MPAPASPTPTNTLLNAVAERLIPLFLTQGQTEAQARATALEGIEAYHPQSPADLANIARILAFSLAALTALGNAADPGLPPNLKLRFYGKANTLSRSADQAERTMTQRHRLQSAPPPKTQAEPKAPPQPKIQPQPVTQPNEAAIFAQIDAAMAEFHALQPGHQAANPPAPFARTATVKPPSLRQALHQNTPLSAFRAAS